MMIYDTTMELLEKDLNKYRYVWDNVHEFCRELFLISKILVISSNLIPSLLRSLFF